MASSIQGAVESQISATNDWASSARESAIALMNAIGAVTVPNTQIGEVPFTPLEIADFTSAAEPEDMEDPGNPPDVKEVTDPITEVPTLELTDPELGEILAISIPQEPPITYPEVDFSMQNYVVTLPEDWGTFAIDDILITDDPLIQACITRLTNNINNGGTGLSADIEADIWARDLERNEQQLQDSTDKATVMWAKKGFSLPDGLLAHSLSEIQKEYMNKLLDRSREIAIEQAKLEQTNLFKSIELAVNLVAHLVDLLIRYETLVLQSQELTAKFANEYIDLQIKTYMSLVDAYKAQAQVYESRMKACQVQIEVFKTQVQAQALIGEVNKQTVEIYVEQLKANIASVELYKAQLDARKTEIDTQRAIIEANKIQVDAWAKKAEVLIETYKGNIERYKAEVTENVASADLAAKQNEVSFRGLIEATKVAVGAQEANTRSNQEQARILMEAAKGSAAAAAAMAAGAMAGLSVSAGMSYGETLQLEED